MESKHIYKMASFSKFLLCILLTLLKVTFYSINLTIGFNSCQGFNQGITA